MTLLLTSSEVVAEEPPRLAVQEHPTDSHILLGPSISAVHSDFGWDSQAGAHLQLHRRRSSPGLAAYGLDLSVASFASYEGIRLTAEFYAGTRLLLKRPVGVALGPVVDLFQAHRPRAGARATLWVYAGVVPYLSLTRTEGLGAPEGMDFEFGLRIPFSLFRW